MALSILIAFAKNKKMFLLETSVDIFSKKISKDPEILKVLIEFLTG